MHWKERAIKCFDKKDFFNVPENFRSEHGNTLQRWSTYYHLINDGGYKAAACLSFLFKPKVVVEFGVHFGWTSLLWCKFNPTARVHGVDRYGHPNDTILPTGYVPLMHDCKNYSLHIMNSYDFNLLRKVNLCYIDGWHFSPTVMLDNLRAWKNCNRKEEWCIVWDDYAPGSPDVVAAVDEFVTLKKQKLHDISGWKWIGSKDLKEEEIEAIVEAQEVL
jgi:hypothetical protein